MCICEFTIIIASRQKPFIQTQNIQDIAHLLYSCIFRDEMPVGRRGLVVPQNTFLENVVRRSNGLRK